MASEVKKLVDGVDYCVDESGALLIGVCNDSEVSPYWKTVSPEVLDEIFAKVIFNANKKKAKLSDPEKLAQGGTWPKVDPHDDKPVFNIKQRTSTDHNFQKIYEHLNSLENRTLDHAKIHQELIQSLAGIHEAVERHKRKLNRLELLMWNLRDSLMNYLKSLEDVGKNG